MAHGFKVAEARRLMKDGILSDEAIAEFGDGAEGVARARMNMAIRHPLVSTASDDEIMRALEPLPLRYVENRLREFHGVVVAKAPVEEEAEEAPVVAPKKVAPKKVAPKKVAKAKVAEPAEETEEEAAIDEAVDDLFEE